MKKSNKAFSLVEVIVIVSVIAVLVGVVSIIMGDTVNAAKDNTKKSNAMTMNKLMDEVRALGGTVADGAGNHVDTSSMTTLIDCLTKDPTMKIHGISFGIKPKPEALDYKLVMHGSKKVVEPILNEDVSI